MKPSAPQLFADIDDDEDEASDEDGGRFDIRPQFEGRAGQKVRKVQLSANQIKVVENAAVDDTSPLPRCHCCCGPADGAAVSLRDRRAFQNGRPLPGGQRGQRSGDR